MKRKRITPVQFIPLSFLCLIAVGTLFLLTPWACADGRSAGFLTALFTATTSVCVTGLVVVDTYAKWSVFGQAVILVLAQIGGLGVVAVGSMLMLIARRKFSLGSRKLLNESLNVDLNKGLLAFLTRIFKGVFLVEGIGAALYSIRFIPAFGVAKGIWISVFQSVSAFCNAGMDIIGPNSMIDFNTDDLLMWTTMLLIIFGGLGFVVWFDVLDRIKDGFKYKYTPITAIRHLEEHSKLVITMTLVLLFIGCGITFAAEYSNPATIGNMGLKDKLLNSLFQSVTFRTAGFASIPQDALTGSTCMIGYVLMFIGGSPVGTAGGVKTVTFFLVFMNALSYIGGRRESVIFHKRVGEEVMRKAAAVVFVSFAAVFTITVLFLLGGGVSLTDGLYEVVSALATVGLSRGLTPNLNVYRRILIIISMYLGRIGPISMAIFFSKSVGAENKIKHSEGTFYVG
ncbi:MAG: potassium transporter TrkH [Lachnospiraceae bacterium]|nr:potassium transporter TrkH [Lachnospiraceae bacterium]